MVTDEPRTRTLLAVVHTGWKPLNKLLGGRGQASEKAPRRQWIEASEQLPRKPWTEAAEQAPMRPWTEASEQAPRRPWTEASERCPFDIVNFFPD